MKDSRFQNSKRNAVAGIVQKLVAMLLPFINRTMILYILGEEFLGLSSLFGSILGVLSLADLGFGSAVVYSLYKPMAENNKQEINALLNLYRKIYRVVGSVILIAGLCVLPFLECLIHGGCPDEINLQMLYLIYLGNTALSYFLFAYKTSLFNAGQRSDITTKIGTGITVLQYGAQFLFLALTRNYYIYMLCMPAATLLNNILTAWFAKRMYPEYLCQGKVDISVVQDIKNRVSALVVHKFGGIIANSCDNLVISAFLGLNIIARYNNYFFIFNAISGFLIVFHTAILASVGNGIAMESKERNKERFEQLTTVNNWVVAWCSICLLCLYQPFMELWVGKELMFGIEIPILFAVYFYFNGTRRVVITYKDAAGLWAGDKWKPFVGGIVNLAVNIVLIQLIGISGVIISTIVSFVFVEKPWETHVLFKNYFNEKETRFYGTQGVFLMVTLLAGGITYMLCELVRTSNILLTLVLRGVLCVLIPNSIVILLYRNNLRFIRRYIGRK